MSLWTAVPLVLASLIVLVILAVIIWRRFNQNVSREDFSDVIRDLLIGMENGAFSRLDCKDSDVWFSFERISGTDTDATLALRIPRTECSERLSSELHRVLKSQGFELIDEVDNPSLLAKILIPIADIWEKNSGATGAHAARIFLEIIGISLNARFRISEMGKVSRRCVRDEFIDRV
jgi:hypothetical protein